MSKTYVREVQERRRSGAAGTHQDKRYKRKRTRRDSRCAAVRESIDTRTPSGRVLPY